ncbi:MAG: altronate dehydratase family protein [Spirochaetia bacterium]
MNRKRQTIRLHPVDNVVVALVQLPVGSRIPEEDLVITEPIEVGHKVACQKILEGMPVKKYGQIIGFASRDINAGQHVHTHNLSVNDFNRDYDFAIDIKPTELLPEASQASFLGIIRADGRIATRNYIGILPTVMCAASVADKIARYFNEDVLRNYPNIDGVVSFAHSTGCGNPGLGLQFLQRVLAGYALHPNFFATIIIGLGCEDNSIDSLIANTMLQESPHLKTLTIQHIGGTDKTVRAGIEMILDWLPQANSAKRTAVSASHLILGLECGGSDAFSGITANPALGVAADLIVKNGGTAVLSETPEIFGAEHLLIRRAANIEVANKIVEAIKWWKKYAAKNNAEINNNPSPGNKKGGISTIAEKSLGAVMKGGSSNLVDFCEYAEPIKGPGLVFMDATSHDTISVTAKVAGGANIVCFTTGRGTPVGNKPVPVLKLASNTPTYHRLIEDFDLNCGVVVDEERTLEEIGHRIFDLILATASGRKTQSEIHGFGDLEFAPWQIGAML